MKKIVVIGLGVIGGSIVLTLNRRSAPYQLIGIDTSKKRRRLLEAYLHESSSDWTAAAGADLVVLCLQFEQILDYLRQAPPNQLMIDVCSGKEKIVALANRRKLRFIGGHPLAGNAYSGEKGWKPDLFEGVPFFLSPAQSAKKADVSTVRAFISNLGARPVRVNAAEHDRYLAVSSHFPAFLSVLFREVSKQVPTIFQGPGYRSMTRLSQTPTNLLDTFLESNGSNIRKSALRFRSHLDRWLKGTQKNK